MNKAILGMALAAILIATPTTMWAQGAATAPATMPGAGAATAPAQVAPKELTDTINKAIGLLEAGKDKEVIELLADPAELQGQDMDKAVAGFKPRAPELLKALKGTVGVTPEVTAASVTYKAKGGGHDLAFFKSNDRWYLR